MNFNDFYKKIINIVGDQKNIYKNANQKYYEENKEELREKHRKYAKDNYAKKRAKIDRNALATKNKIKRLDMKNKVYKLLGRKCKICGFEDIRALQIDHVGGGGRKELRESGGGYKYYQRIMDANGKGYQILCANCNWIKRYTNNEAEPVYEYRNLKNNYPYYYYRTRAIIALYLLFFLLFFIHYGYLGIIYAK